MVAPDATWQRPWPHGWRVEVVAETGSTNADLVAAAGSGAPDRSVLTALHQTAGRGRLDRRWDAPPGANLLASLLFRSVPEHLHEVTQRVALAAREAVRATTGVVPELKWPNDLMIDDAKVAGILAEAGGAGDARFVVVGIGVNVGWAPQGATRVPAGPTPAVLLEELLRAYDALPDDLTKVYRAALGTLGRRVRVERPAGPIEGRAVDVERDGRLVVVDECAITHRVDAGDVIHLRAAPDPPP